MRFLNPKTILIKPKDNICRYSYTPVNRHRFVEEKSIFSQRADSKLSLPSSILKAGTRDRWDLLASVPVGRKRGI
jgi:hypothetical protein